jgi:hypothetical protein
MNPTDDRREKTPLPITAEIGSEGGSYADRTMQGETFSGPEGLPRVEGRGGASSVATYATRQDYAPVSGQGALDSGAVRYATEPPSPPSATQGRPVGGTLNWRAGLIGAAAGAGAALAVGLLRNRRRERRRADEQAADERRVPPAGA